MREAEVWRKVLNGMSSKYPARILEWVAMPPSGDLPDPGTEPKSPDLHGAPQDEASLTRKFET